jgi:hypothetical protein
MVKVGSSRSVCQSYFEYFLVFVLMTDTQMYNLLPALHYMHISKTYLLFSIMQILHLCKPFYCSTFLLSDHKSGQDSSTFKYLLPDVKSSIHFMLPLIRGHIHLCVACVW